MQTIKPTKRTRVTRLPKRAVYDQSIIHAILDEALICHVGFVIENQPYVIPTIHARIQETLYIHGSVASRMLKTLSQGVPACITVTLIDGLVLARSAFHHSMNYRSVVVLGNLTEVKDPQEKLQGLAAIVEHVIPGRSAQARSPNKKELQATSLLSLKIDEASAKIRTGAPVDDEEDYALDIWAGVIPLKLQMGEPLPDSRLNPQIEIPSYIRTNRHSN